MQSLQRMRDHLKTTGLYQLDTNSLVAAEMAAYASVLDALFEQLDQLLKECFFDEVESPRGEIFEELFGLPATKFPLDEQKRDERRRKIAMMKQRLAVKNNDFSAQGIKKLIETGGMTVSFQEDFAQKTITVTVLEDRDYCELIEDKRGFIIRSLPCHSTAVIHL